MWFERQARHSRYLEIPGNHMTVLYDEGPQCIVEAISTFVDDRTQLMREAK